MVDKKRLDLFAKIKLSIVTFVIAASIILYLLAASGIKIDFKVFFMQSAVLFVSAIILIFMYESRYYYKVLKETSERKYELDDKDFDEEKIQAMLLSSRSDVKYNIINVFILFIVVDGVISDGTLSAWNAVLLTGLFFMTLMSLMSMDEHQYKIRTINTIKRLHSQNQEADNSDS